MLNSNKFKIKGPHKNAELSATALALPLYSINNKKHA